MARKPTRKMIAPPTGGRGAIPHNLSDFEKLLQKAIEDHEFAGLLMRSPETAFSELHIKVTQKKLRALADCVDPLNEAYEAFGGLKRMIG